MDSVVIYIIQSSLSLTILYFFYELLFKREAYFQFNRYYLLFAIMISALLPTIDFSIYNLFSTKSSNTMLVAPIYDFVGYTLGEVTIYGGNSIADSNDKAFNPGLTLLQLIIIVYFTGVIIRAVFFGLKLKQLYRLFKKSEVYKDGELQFIITRPGMPVFSFFKYIFMDSELFDGSNETKKIIEHEYIHVKQKHSYDLLIAELVTIFQWFNPFAYLLKKTVKENHEFIADSNVLVTYPDVMAYRKLLINNSTNIKTNVLTHNFSYSLLKRRLFMIKKTKNPLRFSFKLVWVLLALSMVFFACSGPVQKDEMDSSVQKEEFAETGDKASDVFTAVEQMPQYPGGMEVLSAYLSENIIYPEAAKDQSIQGKVFVNFIVDTDGSVDDVKVLRGIGGGCDEEAIRVITAMPEWIPGKQRGETVKVSYSLPIKFVLDEKDTDTIFKVVEVMPEFPGGTKKLMSYLGNNIKYPEKAKKDGVKGRVFITFVVEKDGSIGDVKLLRGIGAGCDEEAMRVIESMPNWKPGMTEGKPVRVQYNLPIKFQLD